jgi:RNA polymerase primary sigma factor
MAIGLFTEQSPEQQFPTEVEDQVEQFRIARLIKLGQQQDYVTYDDILELFPEAEQDLRQLDQAFVALFSAGIPILEEDEAEEPSDEDLIEQERSDGTPRHALDGMENYLENIETDDMVGLYMKEVAQVPLLTAKQEVDLAKRMERGRMARERLARGSVDPKNRQELYRLIEDDWQARENLLVANSRLVISIAKKYMSRGVLFLDLIQEGNIGLIRAAKKFEYRRGFKFSTYATWWIRQAVTRAIADQGRTIRLPVHMGDQINKCLRMQNRLTQRLGHEPTVEELAEALELTPDKVRNLLKLIRFPLSLEAPTDNEDDSVLGDFIEDEEAPAPEETATYNLLREHLVHIFNDLPPREVRILKLRYGLMDGQAYTLEQVGRMMGVTRERVRQIEAQALSRLRQPSIREKLRDYL